MATVKKTKSGFILKCNCGLLHEIDENDNGDFEIETKYKAIEPDKPKLEEKKESEENGKNKQKKGLFED